MEQSYVDSAFGTYCSYITGDLPEALKEKYEELTGEKAEEAVKETARTYLFSEKKTEGPLYEFIHSVSQKELDKLRKKEKYHAGGLLKAVEEDYSLTASGEAVRKSSSPFGSLIVNTLVSTGQKKSVVIDTIYERSSSWLKTYLDFKNASFRSEWIKEEIGFINYPFFYLLEESEPAKAKKLIKLDLTDRIFMLSLEKYKDFSTYLPRSIISEGFIDEGKHRTSKFRQNYDANLLSTTTLKETFFSDEPAPIGQVMIAAPRTWDYAELEIFQALVSKTIRDMDDMSGILSVSGSLTEICSVLYPNVKNKRYNNIHYETAKERLSNIFNTRVVAQAGGKTVSKALFEYFIIDDPRGTDEEKKGKNTVLFQASFGRRIATDIITSQLETIVRPRLESIAGDVARMLYLSLKSDRITDLYFYGMAFHSFTTDSFMIIIRLADRKAQRIEKYTKALKELKEKKLLIESFEVVKDTFKIKWLPLTEEEKADIKIIPIRDEGQDF